MEFHPFSDIWPLLDETGLADLAADIKANGQCVPIIVYQKKILDGRNRELACRKAGVPPRYEDAKAKTDEEALALVWSLNEHRRHASIETRAFAAERYATLKQGGDRSKTSKEVLLIEEAAKLMGVSETAVDRARAIRTHAPELEQEVRDKKISLTAGAEKARSKGRKKKEREKESRNERFARVREDRLKRMLKPPLTPEQVDPAFDGDTMKFTAEHGHTQIRTAAEQRAIRNRLNVSDWISVVKKMAEAAKEFLELPDMDSEAWRKAASGRKERFREDFAIIERVIKRVKQLTEKVNADVQD